MNTLTFASSGEPSLGIEIENSDAFARCQVEKVFRAVCLRAPGNSADRSEVATITADFKASNYNMKTVFAETAVYCKGD